MAVFQRTELLVPWEELLEDWAVIACDQYTSQPDYWRGVRERVAKKPSACHIVYPEAELGGDDEETRIAAINAKMREYLNGKVFRRFPNAYLYIERTLLDGSIRRGVVGVVDLEEYDFREGSLSAVRATEETVAERIPPRVKVRSGAVLETSHVIMMMDDEEDGVLGWLEGRRASLPLLYSVDLMEGGGHIEGRLVRDTDAADLEVRIENYEAESAARFYAMGKEPLLYAVGDGNHSLAAAKTCWEALKLRSPEVVGTNHPARFAMVELQNIRDNCQKFEPIHRVLTEVSTRALLNEAEDICAPGGLPVDWQAGERQGMLFLDRARGEIQAAILQPLLDRYLKDHKGRIDYVHEEEAALKLSRKADAIAFLMPTIKKDGFFRGIAMGGVLPRKSFSLGHAQEKRYYIECRKITDTL